MTPEERQLIAGLFDRMRDYRLPEKDGGAEALINERVRTVPDAPYMLVQSVLVQEQALEEAGNRIKALEEQVRALEGGAQARAPGSGGFLGGFFGSRAAPEPRGASVPVIGARATASAYDSRQPWTPPQGAPPQAAAPQQQAQAPAGGGFMRTAMATAAGVAGGILVAGAISNLLGGSGAHANPAGSATGTADAAASSASETARQESQPQQQDAADDGGGWFGGDSGGDFEI